MIAIFEIILAGILFFKSSILMTLIYSAEGSEKLFKSYY